MKYCLAIIILLFSACNIFFSQTNEKSKKLFLGNCGMCHGLDHDIVGPKLRGVYALRDKKWLESYIVNADSMYKAKDSLSVVLYEKWRFEPHNSQNVQLSKKELKLILKYLKAN